MPKVIHNMSYSPEYSAWKNMKDRCLCKTNHAYPNYGGRGIGIFEPWINSFPKFLEDVGMRPAGNFALERKNNNLGYSPENCAWATMKSQGNNRRNNVRMVINGESKTVAEWSDATGIPHSTLARRIKVGFAPEKVLSSIKFKRPKINALGRNGDTDAILELVRAAIDFEKMSPRSESNQASRARLVAAIVSVNKAMRKATSQ